MTDAQLIAKLGVERLAVIVSQSQSSVRNWKARGIPWRHRVKVAQMAKRRGISLPGDFLTREHK